MIKTRAEEDACYKAIMSTRLETPIVYEPFTQYFDADKLENVRDTFGYDLYIKCLKDATRVVEMYP